MLAMSRVSAFLILAIVWLVVVSQGKAYIVNPRLMGDGALTAGYLLAMGEYFNDTTFQLIGKAFFDIEDTLKESLANRELSSNVGAPNMKNNQTFIEHACELMKCSKWSSWGNCKATWKHFGYGMSNRTRSCGVNTTLCSYPREDYGIEKQTRLCKTKHVIRECPSRFTKIQASGKTFCLLYETSTKSHDYATENCKSLGAELVHINSRAKHDAVEDLTSRSSTTIWINGKRSSNYAPWEFTYGTEESYSNWEPGEPSNGSSELCNVYEGSPKDRWDRSCSSYYASVCEYLLVVGPPQNS